MNSFDEKFYVCETCHRHLHKNETSGQVVCKKMAVDPTPNEVKLFKKLQKGLNF